MSSDSSQDKQLPATERRLRKAREEGQIARSRDLAHFAVSAAALGVLVAAAPALIDRLRRLLAAALRFDHTTATTPERMLERFGDMGLSMLPWVLGLGLVVCAVAVLAAWGSGGWVFTMKALAPKFDKLDPIAGLGRIVSKAQIGDMLKACLLALILATVGGSYLWLRHGEFVNTLAVGLPDAFGEVGRLILSGLWLLVIVLALFAAVDVPLQRFLHASRLKMSHQEVKEEFKQQEGNQEVKGRIKARMREISRRRMMAAVPSADLVVMNPTHYAVALKYDESAGGAPKVVAKGVDQVAMKIRELAAGAQVPVLQAPPLARALYATTEVDHEIPLALYSAVAQVLAHVFRLREAMAGRGPYPGSLPAIAVPPTLDPADPRHVRTAARRGAVTP